MEAEEMSREEKRREEEYRHRHIDIDIVPKRQPKERRLYIPFFWEHRFKQLQAILAREGNSVSRWFREQADPYINQHEPGNPQQRIDTIMRIGKPYRAHALCQCGAKASRRVVLEDGSVIFSCSIHMPRRVRSYKVI